MKFLLNFFCREILEKLPKPTCRRTTRTNITIQFWVSQFAMLLWGSRLHGFVSHCTDFLHGFLAQIFCPIFCTDFLHGFSAQIFCTVFARLFCTDFFADCSHELFVQMFARIFARIFLFFGGVQDTWGEAPKFHRENPPQKFTMLWEPSGEGLGRQEGEVRLWSARPGQSLRGLGLGRRRRK